MKELIASDAKAFLLLTATTTEAKANIEAKTPLKVRAAHMLKEKNNIFHDSCSILSATEKIGLLPYCNKADRQNPKGYGKCGLILVLSHKTPNNSIPVLHANHAKWQGIFPRYLNVA